MCVMSKERELLKTILAYMCAEYLVITEFEMIAQIEDTVKEIQELLAQPEQEPVAWIIETEIEGKLSEWVCTDKKHYMDASDGKDPIPLYTAPPKREPLTSKLISLGNNCHESFIKGVRFAEKMHGIGGGE